MKTNHMQQKRELVALVLLGGAAAFAVLILVKTAGFFVTLARADSIVDRAFAQTSTNVKDVDRVIAKHQSLAKQLKTNNLFAPPPPKQNPVKEVSGIFGDEALINGQWVQVGGSVGDAKILAIGPASVTVTWNDTEKVFLPIDASSSDASKGPKPRKAVNKSRGPGGPGRPGLVVSRPGKKPTPGRKEEAKTKKAGGDADWTRKMSLNDLRGAREKIQAYIQGMRAKGITDPAQYEGARRKMEVVEDAIEQRGDGK